MSKIFIISELSFEYNDEIYYNDTDGGEPVEAYTTREKAQEACDAKTIKWLQGSELEHYAYSLEDIVDVDAVIKATGLSQEAIEDAWSDQTFNSLFSGKESDVVHAISITPFKVVEIELKS